MGFRSSVLWGLVSLIDSRWASGHLHCWVWCLFYILYGLQVICIVGSGVSHLDSLWASGHLHCWVWCLSSRLSMGFRSGEFAGQSSTVTPMVIEPWVLLVPLAVWAGAFGTFGSVGRCQVLLEN